MLLDTDGSGTVTYDLQQEAVMQKLQSLAETLETYTPPAPLPKVKKEPVVQPAEKGGGGSFFFGSFMPAVGEISVSDPRRPMGFKASLKQSANMFQNDFTHL